MFNKFPFAVAHRAAEGLVTPDFIVRNKRLFNRTCPHRYFPIGEVGTRCVAGNLRCPLHNYIFDSESGKGLGNPYNLPSKPIVQSRSGIIWNDFEEPEDHWWPWRIADDYVSLQLDKTFYGKSSGSWLWNMEMAVDVKHIEGIHPWLHKRMQDIEISHEEGDGWVIQYWDNGFWLFVFPFTFIEWAPYQLSIITNRPDDVKNEYGYSWFTQIYRDPNLSLVVKDDFDMVETVWREDVAAVEKIQRPFKPTATMDPLERHNFLFSKWYLENKPDFRAMARQIESLAK